MLSDSEWNEVLLFRLSFRTSLAHAPNLRPNRRLPMALYFSVTSVCIAIISDATKEMTCAARVYLLLLAGRHFLLGGSSEPSGAGGGGDGASGSIKMPKSISSAIEAGNLRPGGLVEA